MAYTIAVDAGHGIKTAGKRTPPLPQDMVIGGKIVRKKGEVIHEYEHNVAVQKRLMEALTRCGQKAVDITVTDTDPALTTRQQRCRAAMCDASISVHYNAGRAAVGGVETFWHSNDESTSDRSKALATLALTEMLKVRNQTNRKVKRDAFAVCNENSMRCPCILIECGFMDDPRWIEQAYMLDPAYHRDMGEALGKAVCAVLGVAYVAPGGAVTPAPVAPVPDDDPRPILRKGSKGEAVKRLQTLLNKEGFGVLAADGDFGPKTDAAVKAAQRANGFEASGVTGAGTWRVLGG